MFAEKSKLKRGKAQGRLAQWQERYPYKVDAAGSSPAPPTVLISEPIIGNWRRCLKRLEPRHPKGKREKDFPSGIPFWGENSGRGERPLLKSLSEMTQFKSCTAHCFNKRTHNWKLEKVSEKT